MCGCLPDGRLLRIQVVTAGTVTCLGQSFARVVAVVQISVTGAWMFLELHLAGDCVESLEGAYDEIVLQSTLLPRLHSP